MSTYSFQQTRDQTLERTEVVNDFQKQEQIDSNGGRRLKRAAKDFWVYQVIIVNDSLLHSVWLHKCR